MDMGALNWYQWIHNNGQIVSFQNLLHALQLRFARSHFGDPQGALYVSLGKQTFNIDFYICLSVEQR